MKKLIGSFLIITLLTLNIHHNVYAIMLPSYINALKNVVDMYVAQTDPDEQATITMLDELLESGGFISNLSSSSPNSAIASGVISYMASQVADMQENATMRENIAAIKEALESGVDTSNGVSISDSFKSALINTANYYMSENISYVYSYTNYELAGLYSSADAYVKANNMIHSNIVSQQYWFLTSYSGINRLYSVSKSQYPYLYLRIDQINRADNFAQGYLFDGLTNTVLDGSNIDMYQYNGSEWVSSTYFDNVTIGVLFENQSFVRPVNRNSNKFFVSLDDRIALRAHVGMASSTDVLYQPYYINEDVWNDFSTSSGDYTYDNSNVNTVTYGDITNYIDSFNQNNGYPPSIPEININIENQNNDNISGGSGGGSGDGGSGDGGSDDGIGDIFGWLKGLGSAIASLIKGLGEFLTEIIAGLTEALTELIGGISDLIISVTETIPTVYMEFLRACFGWMPEEWVGLFGAAVLVMVLVGIIKIIRG